MKIKNTPFEPDPKDPFKNDKLKRIDGAENLTYLVKTITQPFVLGINAPFGTGKTTFVRMWAQHLANQGITTLYFNAWETDYFDDPLISFIGEIQSALDNISLDASHKKKLNQYIKKAKSIGAKIIERSIPVALKIGTAGVLDLDKFTEESISKLVEKIAQERIDNYRKDKNTLIAFRKTLEDFAIEITNKNEQNSPLIFIIDELDRCKPTYAVELLERVKHLFSVSGIVFVLVFDRAQLRNSVKCLFGADIDFDGYIRRFIDLSYELPPTSLDDFCIFLFDRFEIQHTLNQKFIDGDQGFARKELIELFIQLMTLFRLSARAVEQCVARLNLIYRITPPGQALHPIFLAFLVILKAHDEITYAQFCSEKLHPDKLIEYLHKLLGFSELLRDEKFGDLLEVYIRSAFTTNKEYKNLIGEYKELLESQSGSEDGKLTVLRKVEILREFKRRGCNKIAKHITRRVELVEPFFSS